MDEYVLGLGLW